MNFLDFINSQIVIIDGAMGTRLQSLNLNDLPESYNLKNPEIVLDIHKSYVENGSSIAITNTFGANDLKLKNTSFSLKEIISSAIKIAKEANPKFVALSIGPLGILVEPIGDFDFETAVSLFSKQISIALAEGIDAIYIQTMSNLNELRAAIIAAKECCDLPILASMTFEKNMRTFTGTNVESFVLTCESLGVSALGFNCCEGPKQVSKLILEASGYTNLPLIAQPNAGLPTVKNGISTYNMNQSEFLNDMKTVVLNGANIIGGCCGSSFEHIKSITQLKDLKPLKSFKVEPTTKVCSMSKCVEIGKNVVVIGERINPTGRKKLKNALKNKNYDFILKEAKLQIKSGANIIDLNVGTTNINQVEVSKELILKLSASLKAPIQIDSDDPRVIETAARVYPGRILINSVSAKNKSLNSILPIASKYGAVIVGLCLSENGIPSNVEERVAIAKKIVYEASQFNILKHDILIDCITLSASTNQKELFDTLKAISKVKALLGVKTTLGASNISFGLPNRELLNSSFLTLALYEGLDAPITDPLKKSIMDSIKAFEVLSSKDLNSKRYIDAYFNSKATADENLDNFKINPSTNSSLIDLIVDGLEDDAASLTDELLNIISPYEIIENHIVVALNKVGALFESGDFFLPQMLASSDTVKKCFEVIKSKYPKSNLSKNKIILATVEGDVHDIGKNIVCTMLENYGFDVIDLGKDVSAIKILKAVQKHNASLVGLSCLMTTTLNSMKNTISLIKEHCSNVKFMVGGAVVNQSYADEINADFYAKDANASVNIAQLHFKNKI